MTYGEVPKVTVYVVNHNYERYLEQAVLSVLGQSMQDFELIIIDDGSTDNSRAILEKFDDHPKVVTIAQHNHGLNVSNNIALRAASGRYIMRLDADDYLDRHCLAILSAALDEDENLCLVFPDYYRIDAEGNLIEVVRRHDFDEVTLLDVPAHGACTMIRRKYLEGIGGYDEEFRCQDGYEIWLRMTRNYGVKNVNVPLFFYRQHSKNLTRDEVPLLETRSRILEKIADRQTPASHVLAVIPVRGLASDPHSLALRSLGGRPLIDWTVDEALRAKRISGVVVTSPDEALLAHIDATYGDRVLCVRRDRKLARLNVYVHDALLGAAEAYAENHPTPDVLAVLMIESPFRTADYIDSAVNAIEVFQTDAVVTVRPERDVFYRHNGAGMETVSKGQNLRLEGEDLFREAGQLRVVKFDCLREGKEPDQIRLGHVVVDQRAALVIQSEWDWRIAEFEAQQGVESGRGGAE